MPLIDITGNKYNNWKVISYSGNEKWKCQCKCGLIKDVGRGSLKNGTSKSCGCRQSPCEEEYKGRKKKYILNNISISDNNCWNWNRYKNDRGYGTMSYRKKQGQRVNRIAWLIWKGEIPKGLFVLHKCDNPSCCNPDHLFLGTHDDNMRDMALKGRACKGKNSHLHKSNRGKLCLKKS